MLKVYFCVSLLEAAYMFLENANIELQKTKKYSIFTCYSL